MKIFISGSTGLLGRTIAYENKDYGFKLFGLYYPEKEFDALKLFEESYFCDITEYKLLSRIISKIKPDVIVHAASNANVDWVEKNKDAAYKNNFEGLKNIFNISATEGIRFIHISSNAIYDGNNPLYSEDSERKPLNYYGKLKVLEEDYVISNSKNHTIIRPILMYGWNDTLERDNPFTWQLKLQKNNSQIKLVDDIFCNPLLANDCAKVILELIKKNIFGIFNIAGSEILSRYEFGIKIAESTGYGITNILPVPNSSFIEIAPRPKNTSFNISKVENILKMRSVSEGLSYLLNENKIVKPK